MPCRAELCRAVVVPPQLGAPGSRRVPRVRRASVLSRSAQLFSGDVLKMFSSDCKRMSAEIFGQTMPLGKHWRVGLRTGGSRCRGAAVPGTGLGVPGPG